LSELLTQATLDRYNVSGPRYTSYPTAPEWKDGVEGGTYLEHLKRVGEKEEPLSLYVHIPFCSSLCTYCGCHVAIRKPGQEIGHDYIDLLEKELELVASAIGRRKTLQQLHWGGGTPTFLLPEQLERLKGLVDRHFDLADDAEVAIEIEPRRVNLEMLKLLRKLGFNRVSMGVQDLDPKVQEAIRRIHPPERIREVVEGCRDAGFESVNLDLIYGLPHQDRESFAKTVQEIISLRPDRIALYSFAHVPWLKKHQKAIDPASLPSPDEKVGIFLDSTKGFLDGGYEAIGMDHFALKEDDMAVAYREGRLHRNFMGYTVLKGNDFIGLGVSSIGYVQGGYFQNEKDMKTYRGKLENGEFPLERGLVLSDDDLMRRKIIEDLMCRFAIDRKLWEQDLGKPFDEVFTEEKPHISDCLEDGLLEEEGDLLKVTELGKLFVRNIAMGFDAHLRKEGAHRRFSRVI